MKCLDNLDERKAFDLRSPPNLPISAQLLTPESLYSGYRRKRRGGPPLSFDALFTSSTSRPSRESPARQGPPRARPGSRRSATRPAPESLHRGTGGSASRPRLLRPSRSNALRPRRQGSHAPAAASPTTVRAFQRESTSDRETARKRRPRSAGARGERTPSLEVPEALQTGGGNVPHLPRRAHRDSTSSTGPTSDLARQTSAARQISSALALRSRRASPQRLQRHVLADQPPEAEAVHDCAGRTRDAGGDPLEGSAPDPVAQRCSGEADHLDR